MPRATRNTQEARRHATDGRRLQEFEEASYGCGAAVSLSMISPTCPPPRRDTCSPDSAARSYSRFPRQPRRNPRRSHIASFFPYRRTGVVLAHTSSFHLTLCFAETVALARAALQIAKYPQVVDFVNRVRTRIASRATWRQGDVCRRYGARAARRARAGATRGAGFSRVREITFPRGASHRNQRIPVVLPRLGKGLIGCYLSTFFFAAFAFLSKYLGN